MLFFTYDIDQDLLLKIKNVSLSDLLKEVAGQTHFSKVDFKRYSLDRSRRPILFCWE